MEIELPKLHSPNALLSSAVQMYLETMNEQYIQVWLNGEKEDAYSASYFLRKKDKMPELELIALSMCKGKILDIGAGAGAHSALLTQNQFNVTALENDPGFCTILRTYAGLNVVKEDFFRWQCEDKFDTILLLMNGFGIAQRAERLSEMMARLKKLLSEKGKILVEVTDYKFSPEYDHSIMNNPEATFRLMYEGDFSHEFHWLYPNLEMIETYCNAQDMSIKLIFQEDETLLLEISKPS
ncbi:MAG: class I SAM-dependent methyltransferase [Flavobacteriales bacterium]